MGCANAKCFPFEDAPTMSSASTQVYDGQLLYLNTLSRQQGAEIFRLERELCASRAEVAYFRQKYFQQEFHEQLEMKRRANTASTLV